MTSQKTPPHDLPAHPQAALVADQLQLLDALLDEWHWQTYPGGDLVVVARLRTFGRTLRVWVNDDQVNIDVHCGSVPFDAHMLTWLLMENFGGTFKARVTDAQDGFVPVYLTAEFDLEVLERFAQLVWAGFQASLTRWGRILQVKVPAPAEPLIA